MRFALFVCSDDSQISSHIFILYLNDIHYPTDCYKRFRRGKLTLPPSVSEKYERSADASSLPPSDYSREQASDRHLAIKRRLNQDTIMSGLECLAAENIWFDKNRYDEAERRFYEGVNGPCTQSHQQEREASAILQDIANSRQYIQQCLNGSSSHAGGDQELISRMRSLELENQSLHQVVEEMRAALQKLESRVAVLERSPSTGAVPCAKAAPVQQVKVENGGDDDDDLDLFGSDEEEDAEAARIRQERLDAYAAKKAKKPALIAKSSILLDVKPWDDETDMAKLEECVRSVQADGLLWGASKLVPVGYGIKKLQINCVVEDDKVGTDMLEEEIIKFEDYVQSVDVAAFNKI
uniref:Eukaryotic translation elongation factor 1 delta a (guanine nucleotide exchange protein) n=2 Tax=Myripristis murdjan TaxID=586833 RepID=A0A667Y5D1_9TELE